MTRIHRGTRREPAPSPELIDQVRGSARPLRGAGDLDPLVDRIGDARFVLLGEASHGTSEFYTWRAAISRRLIEEKGFSFIAVEGDWPDCHRVDRYVKGRGDAPASARETLRGFQRWPTWMWANEEVAELVEWLRGRNDSLSEERKAGFYGLDVYSLWDSLHAILEYVRKHDPAALPAAMAAFRCFEPFAEDVHDYAGAARFASESCEDEVVELLREMRRIKGRDEPPTPDQRETRFAAEQNALVLRDAEAYYRAMVRGGSETWNLRDRHMVETLERLVAFHGPDARAIVWEHNTHVGDARFTDMNARGEVNVGQLVRERREADGVVIVGFSAWRGTVIAGREWEAPMRRMTVPPGREGSWEDVLHRASGADALLLFDDAWNTSDALAVRGHRAIGVVYHPERERFGNYVPTVLPRRYDALLHFERAEALRPLAGVPVDERGEVPETFPSGV